MKTRCLRQILSLAVMSAGLLVAVASSIRDDAVDRGILRRKAKVRRQFQMPRRFQLPPEKPSVGR